METKTNRDMKETKQEVNIINKIQKKEVVKQIPKKKNIIIYFIANIIIILLITSLSFYLIANKNSKTEPNESTIKNGTEVIENNIFIDKTKLINNNNEIFDNNNKVNIKDTLIINNNTKQIKTDNNITNCDIGFFIPNDNDGEKICQKCQIDKCAKCYGNKLNNKCTLCQTDSNPIIKNNVITYCRDCETGSDEKCLKCDLNKNQCSSCNPGYFIPEDDDIKKMPKMFNRIL